MSTPTLPDGIYFRLPMDDYLALERLSKSGIKKLRISPADYWADSHLNPLKEELTPEQERYRERAKMLGRAYHAARLEPELFAAEYVREPGKEEAPEGTLFTADAMKDEIRERNEGRDKAETVKLSGSTAEIAERLAADGFPREKLWHLVMADWEATIPEGAIKLSSVDYDKIAEDGRRLRSMEAVADLLTGGAAEVSVLYTCPETGIPMKARFDYLKADRWVELKTFSNSNGKHLYQCITDAIRFNRYHIDAASYLQAVEAMVRDDLPIKGDPTKAERAIIEGIAGRAGEIACHFLFQQTGGVPNVLDRRFRFYEETGSEKAIAELEAAGATEDHLERARRFQEISDSQRTLTAVHTKARLEIKAAKRDWLAYQEIYERGEPWLPFNPSGEITDADFHERWLEEI